MNEQTTFGGLNLNNLDRTPIWLREIIGHRDFAQALAWAEAQKNRSDSYHKWGWRVALLGMILTLLILGFFGLALKHKFEIPPQSVMTLFFLPVIIISVGLYLLYTSSEHKRKANEALKTEFFKITPFIDLLTELGLGHILVTESHHGVGKEVEIKLIEFAERVLSLEIEFSKIRSRGTGMEGFTDLMQFGDGIRQFRGLLNGLCGHFVPWKMPFQIGQIFNKAENRIPKPAA